MLHIIRQTTIFCFLLLGFNAFAQNIEIPDENFKAHIVELFDTDEDMEISTSEAELIFFLNFGELGIRSIRGIEHFPNLSSLKIFSNDIDTLDLHQNKELEEILSFTPANFINIQNLEELIEIQILGGDLNQILLSNNPSLEQIHLNGGTIENLDLSTQGQLKYLSVANFPIKEFSTDGLENLIELSLNVLDLDSLDVSNLSSLTRLDCFSNNLSLLILGDQNELKSINANTNKLSTLNIETQSKLEHLELSSNMLDSIPPEMMSTTLKNLGLAFNNIKYFPSDFFPSLELLALQENDISEIDLSNLGNLSRLIINSTDIRRLDLSNNSQLNDLVAYGCPQLEYINIKNGSNEGILSISGLQSIKRICVDQSQLESVAQRLRDFDYTFGFGEDSCFLILPRESQELLPQGLELTYILKSFSDIGEERNTFTIDGATTVNDQICQVGTFEQSSCDLRNINNYLISNQDSILAYNELTEKFELLYDFSLNVGDTMRINLWDNDITYDTVVYARVEEIDSISIGDQLRKTMKVIYDRGEQELIDFTNSELEAEWIEGIGSTTNFFHFTGLGLCDKRYNVCLLKVKEPTSEEIQFDNCISSTNDSEFLSIYKIFPNPSHNQLSIESKDDKINQVKIYNLLGELVAEFKNLPNQNLHELSIRHLNSGAYIISIHTDRDILLHHEKFIKQ